ncbi:protocadherin beta-15-like isoform X2 [Stegostoma tigrinum]|uniref:protocadherin beta-15-like isoform X2 n=1 Tax=Stegostoma tigrinum TaxID=3053191 RepID=UPI00286FFC01|nr:protocadherin beta-15-like isoform X2 [Stegostoma tigrinum]
MKQPSNRLLPISTIFLLCVWNLVSGQIRYSIPEELQHGAFVGKISKDLNLTVEELSRRKFRIVSASSMHYLDVNRMNGILFVNKRIDREHICGQSATCLLSLEAVLENPVEQYQVEVEIVDINDNSPSFPNSEIRLEIAESAMPGGRFFLEHAHDVDAGNNSVRTYHLTPNEHFTLDVQSRGRRKVPELVLKNFLDREKQANHRLLLTAFDGGSPERTGTAHIAIIILDTNDNAPVFRQSLYTVSLMEDAPQGSLVIKLNATDLDEGPNGEVVYSFSSYNEESVSNMFTIDSISGEIRVKGILDFEDTNNYEIDVEAKDRSLPPLSAHCNVRVEIRDVNDNPPDLLLNSISGTISEDAPVETLVALISVTDGDSNKNGHTDCLISPNVPFDLKSPFRNSYRLITNKVLDRENIPEYKITVTCTDRGSPSLSTNKTIVLQISDINDNAPRFTQSSYKVYVTENNVPESSIGSVTAFDPDIAQNSQITYTIVEKSFQQFPASSYVHINPNNGTIFSKQSFDYEQLKSFQIHVQAQDAGLPSLSSNVAVNVIVLDQNDNRPIIISPGSETGTNLRVPRSAEPGYLVTKIIASDADSGQNGRLFYLIIQSSDPGLFTISRNSGEVRSVRRFKDSNAETQRLIVQVKDNGYPPLSATATITLTIVEESTNIQPDVSDPSKDFRDSERLTFYIIISLGATSFVLLIVIIVLVVAVCPMGGSSAHGRGWSLSDCCCSRELEYQSSGANLQYVPDSNLIPNILEFRGNGSFSENYRYKIRSTPEPAELIFTKYSPQIPSTTERNAMDASQQSGKLTNNWSVIPNEVGQMNTDWRSSEPHIVGKISSQCLEDNLNQDDVKREFNRRHTAAAEVDNIKASPNLEDGLPTWAPRFGSQHVENLEPDEYQSNIYLGGTPVMLSSRQDQVVKQDGQHSASSAKKKKKRTKRSEKRENKSTKEEPENE